jgi:hypothetical protein
VTGEYRHPLRPFLPEFYGEVTVFNRIQLCNETETKKEKKEKKIKNAPKAVEEPPKAEASEHSLLATDVLSEPSVVNQTAHEPIARQDTVEEKDEKDDGSASVSRSEEPQYRWRRVFSFSVPGSNVSVTNIEGVFIFLSFFFLSFFLSFSSFFFFFLFLLSFF